MVNGLSENNLSDFFWVSHTCQIIYITQYVHLEFRRTSKRREIELEAKGESATRDVGYLHGPRSSPARKIVKENRERKRKREKGKREKERERKKDGMSTDGQTRIPSSFLNSSMSSITWLVMAEVGGGSPRRPVAGAGYWMAASHLSRACGSVAGDGVGTERNRTARHSTKRRTEREKEKERNRTETERETQGIGGAAGECLEVEDVRVVGWTGESRRRIWRGCEKAS